MLINIPNSIPNVPRLVVVPLLLLVFSLYYYQFSYNVDSGTITMPEGWRVNITEAISSYNATIAQFWQDGLAPALQKAKPFCKPVRIASEVLQDSDNLWVPAEEDINNSQHLLNFTAEDETALLRAHYKMRRTAQYLAPKLPIFKNTSGIVTTLAPDEIPAFLISLRMLRRSGCMLPMQVYFSTWNDYDSHTCNVLFSSLHAKCVILTDLSTTNTTISPPNPGHAKILALLFSPFEHILYLDIGTMPTYDPTLLFSIPPYTTHGLVTWPDFMPPSTSAHFYHIATIPEPPMHFRTSTAAATFMLNKSLHAPSLLMMAYYTLHGPAHFYPLLCASSSPTCFKETLAHAAAAVSLPHYHVRTRPHTVGRWMNGTYRAVGLALADPGLDFDYHPPPPTHIHDDAHWTKFDLAHPDAAVEEKLNVTRHAPRGPRPVFIFHDNAVVNLDPKRVLADPEGVMFEPDGTPVRIWGVREGMVGLVGFDVEKRMWDVVAAEACREDWDTEECRVVQEFVREVVGWMDSIDRPW